MSKPNQTDAFPVPPGLRYRATFSLPAQLAKDIARLARRMGVSQSALLAELLAAPIAAMLEVVETIPEAGATPADVKRARGKSVALIREAVQQTQDLANELGQDDDSPSHR